VSPPAGQRIGCRAAAVAAFLLVPRLLVAQLPVEPGMTEPSLLPRGELDQAIGESRFRLGSVYLTPVLAITQATYDNNVFAATVNPTGDFLATVSAGVDLILPLGQDVFFRLGAFPAYTFSTPVEAMNFFGGQFGGSFSIFLNRLTIEAGAGYSKQLIVYSSEYQARVIQGLGTVRLGAELRILRRLFVYGEGQIQQFRFSGPGAESAIAGPATTDRTTDLVRAEIRYRPSDSVRIGVGVQQTTAEFVYAPQQYDNLTRSVIGDVYYERGKIFMHASGGYTEGKATHGSTVPPFSGLIGSGFASYSLLPRLKLEGFAAQNLNYGLSSPYYVSARYGGGVVVKVGWRLNLQGFGYLGTDSYSTPTPVAGVGLVDRVDDVTGYGGGLNFILSSRFQLQFLGTESRYNSNVPGNDRSFFRWTVSLGLGGNLLK
jgi:hypothetical protein